MSLILRPYQNSDKEACLALFDGNTPVFFAPFERAEFEDFLDKNAFPYFVVEEQGMGMIQACGGYAIGGESATLCWGMVMGGMHRRGMGTFLLKARLQDIRQDAMLRNVRIQTSQHSAGFFARAGFVTRLVVKDGFAEGLDRYEMVLPLK
jgi:Acetyltransferase (GNAT) domain